MLKGQFRSITFTLILLYLVLFFFVYPVIGDTYFIFSIIPSALITWQYRFKYGLFGYIALMFFLFSTSVILPINVISILKSSAFVGGSVIIIICLYAVHWLANIIQRLKITEASLKTILTKQETMIANISDVIAIMDLNGIVTYKSPNVKKHFGWDVSELIGKSAYENVHPNDLHYLKSEFLSLLQGEKNVVSGEFKYRCKDGSYKDVFLSAKYMFNHPNVKGILMNFHDITVRKKARERLIDSEIKYRTLFERSVDVVCMIDVEGNITDINKAGIELYEYSRKELLSMNIKDLVYPEDKEHSKAYLNQLQRVGFYKMYEGRIVTKLGKIKWIQVSSTAFLQKGKVIGSQDVIRDITDRKEDLERLRGLNATKDKFFSIISHDLRNPFASIIGFSELLVANVKANKYEKLNEFTEIIRDTAVQSDKLLSNLLAWSKLQRGKLAYSPEYIMLELAVDDVFDLYLGNAKQKNIKLEFSAPDDLSLYADSNMLNTILRNLISNAIKFTPNGGMVTVSAENLNRKVQISVSDTGVGIPEQKIKNLFSIEGNTVTEGTENEKGTGLGLILCKDFVEKQGGKIWIKSELNIGSTFYFTIKNTSIT